MLTIRLKNVVLGFVAFNVLLFILVDISIKISQGWDQNAKVRIPSKRFWKKEAVNKAFWNRRQQYLDYIHNPLFVSDNATNADVNGTTIVTGTIQPLLLDMLNDTPPADLCAPDHRVETRISEFDALPQRFKDFILYMRCRSYPLILNEPELCREPPFLLLAIKSLAPHFDRRQAIRQTWGRAGKISGHKVQTMFLLGSASSTDHFPDLADMLRHESSLHHDIVQWEFRDSFFNLTVKEVLFLEWLTDHCSGARFVFKGDDDVFVNTRQILSYLGGLRRSKANDLFIGDVITGAGPHRNKKLKYYIPESFFQGSYPPYAGGGGYLFSGKLIPRLHEASQRVALYPIDDAYTGMCLQKLGLLPEKHKGFRTFDIDAKQRDNTCAYDNLMLVHSRTPQEVIEIWAKLQDPSLHCPAVTMKPTG